MPERVITVSHDCGGYDIRIERGQRFVCGDILHRIQPGHKALVVADDTVSELYGPAVLHSLDSAGFRPLLFKFPHGEHHKTIETVTSILETAAAENMNRNDFFVSLGGGVCGDITGFAASVYMRGIPYVQMPTTLLAMVDASVGGKTAVNLSAGKNLAGAFWQPAAVLMDPDMLDTMGTELWDDGMAEIIKHAVLAGGELAELVSAGNIRNDIERVIAMNVEIKNSFVNGDVRDRGKRQMLNLGHTIGHGIEKVSEYHVSHGHAVAAGMLAEIYAFFKMNFVKCDLYQNIKAILNKNSLFNQIDFDKSKIADAVLRDKKIDGQFINLTVPEKMGCCHLFPLPVSEVKKFIESGLSYGYDC